MLENKLFEALLDVIPFKAYATDVKTFEVVYANKMMRENMYAPAETYCWKKVFGQEEICSWCSIIDLEILRKKNKKADKYIIEFFDETDDKWLKSYDELMSWPDGRKVKYSILVDITDQKEIQGSMIKSHAAMAMKNKQMTTTNKKLQIAKLKLQKSIIELDQFKNNLEVKVKEEIEKRKEKEKMLFQQSKLASMGEMMDAVAHQWKQPINIISMGVDVIDLDFMMGKIDENYINEFKNNIFLQINHMTNTLDEFRSFFRPNKEYQKFNMEAMINSVLLLIQDDFIKNKIEITVNITQNFTLIGIENEFKHLVLNILNNSKDAFNENNLKNRKININILENKTVKKLEITDNAGGIPIYILNDIFKANI